MEAFELAQKNGQALFFSSIFITYSKGTEILNGTQKRRTKTKEPCSKSMAQKTVELLPLACLAAWVHAHE